MMPPPHEVLSRAIDVLSEQVLPDLPPSTWTAANVRACITLLTYVHDAFALGPELLAADAKVMLGLMQAALESQESWLDAPLRADLAAAVEISQSEAPSDESNERRRELLSRLVTQSVGRRSDAFESKLRACLQTLNETEFRSLSRASKLPPF